MNKIKIQYEGAPTSEIKKDHERALNREVELEKENAELRAKVAELEEENVHLDSAHTVEQKRADRLAAKVAELEQQLESTGMLLEATAREGVIGIAMDERDEARAERDALAGKLERVREIAERSDKYGEQSLAIREILALLNGLTCCKGEYDHCPECGGHRRLDEDTWVCDHCRNNKRLPAPPKEEDALDV